MSDFQAYIDEHPGEEEEAFLKKEEIDLVDLCAMAETIMPLLKSFEDLHKVLQEEKPAQPRISGILRGLTSKRGSKRCRRFSMERSGLLSTRWTIYLTPSMKLQ
jgi:hypothetical protein